MTLEQKKLKMPNKVKEHWGPKIILSTNVRSDIVSQALYTRYSSYDTFTNGYM